MNQNHENIDEHLLLQYLLGNAGAEEQRRIEAWLNESKEHRSILDRLESLWLETGKLSPAPVAVDVDAAWEKVKTKMQKPEPDRSHERQGKVIQALWLRIALGAAAVFLLLVGIYGLYRIVMKPAAEIIVASNDQVLTDTLPDGSVVSLNKRSRMAYPEKFTGKTREVKLIGEAFFDIRHDSARPFIVDAGVAMVRVLGTSFRMSAYPDSIAEVHVKRGRVLFFTIDPVTGDTSGVVLTAGQKGWLPLKSVMPEIAGDTIPDDLFWFDHSLEFRGTPLSEVFGLLEKHYPVTILVSNAKIYNCRLTASFADDPIDGILQVIAESFDLKIISSDNNYLLTGDGCMEAGK